MGLDLTAWINIWLGLLQPSISIKGSQPKPLIPEYQRVKSFLEKLDKKNEYRITMLGATEIVDAPTDYYISGVQQKIGIEAWERLTLSDQGRHIAYMQLGNMLKLVSTDSNKKAGAKDENKNDLKNFLNGNKPSGGGRAKPGR